MEQLAAMLERREAFTCNLENCASSRQMLLNLLKKDGVAEELIKSRPVGE